VIRVSHYGPPEDRFSPTPAAAAAHERWRARERGEDPRDEWPTKAECDRDEAGY
jgi:hypothetical protein